MSTAFDQGYQSGKARKPRSSNPNINRGKDRDDWFEGWQKGFNEAGGPGGFGGLNCSPFQNYKVDILYDGDYSMKTGFVPGEDPKEVLERMKHSNPKAVYIKVNGGPDGNPEWGKKPAFMNGNVDFETGYRHGKSGKPKNPPNSVKMLEDYVEGYKKGKSEIAPTTTTVDSLRSYQNGRQKAQEELTKISNSKYQWSNDMGDGVNVYVDEPSPSKPKGKVRISWYSSSTSDEGTGDAEKVIKALQKAVQFAKSVKF